MKLNGHSNPIYSVTFSANGRYLATGSEDNTAKIWDVESGKEVIQMKGHMSAVYCVTFNPSGKYLATGSGDNTVKIWDFKSGKELT